MTSEDFHKQPTLQGGNQHEPKGTFPPVDLPKMIGPYKIENLLEKGGMSILYLGIHPETKELTTIKALLPKYLSHPDVVQRFLNEAEIIAMTDHPNIIKLFGHGEWAGGLYIAMEFVQGYSLRQHLLESPLSLKRALEIVIDIAYALCHLHTHGVIHRDLKPENILITDMGEVKVIDFGIAQLLTEKNPGDTPSSQRLIGTPIYMSPEQRENPESVSYPSDIYSLGIIAYELVLGKLSHGQIHLSLMPKGLQKILAKTLQPKPQDRYLDIVDFITDISSYLNSAGFEKESHPSDHLFDLLENLNKAQRLILPPQPPQWKDFSLGIGMLRGQHLHGFYHDFFNLTDQTYAIIQMETSAKGAEGTIHAAMLRGMLHTLIPQKYEPEDIAKSLGKLLKQDHINDTIALNYIVLRKKERSVSFVSCGKGSLWIISEKGNALQKLTNDNNLLGNGEQNQFNVNHLPVSPGDVLILCAVSPETDAANTNKFMQAALSEISQEIDIQQKVDLLLRKAKNLLPPNERPLSLIGVVIQK